MQPTDVAGGRGDTDFDRVEVATIWSSTGKGGGRWKPLIIVAAAAPLKVWALVDVDGKAEVSEVAIDVDEGGAGAAISTSLYSTGEVLEPPLDDDSTPSIPSFSCSTAFLSFAFSPSEPMPTICAHANLRIAHTLTLTLALCPLPPSCLIFHTNADLSGAYCTVPVEA